MAHFRNQYGQVTDPQTDKHGNPIHHTTGTGARTKTGFDTTTAGGMGTYHVEAPTARPGGHHDKGRQEHHRSGSSSSSEDDGQGGRRKKAVRVGGNKHNTSHTTTATDGVYDTTGTGHGQHQQGHEKKGIVEKIKEKLTGTHHEMGVHDTARTGHVQRHEKEGMVDKVKEKLPGNQHEMETSHTTAAPGVYDTKGIGTHYRQGHEKKGMMDNIKEKLPASHH